MAGTKISALGNLSSVDDSSIFPAVSTGTNYKVLGSTLKAYVLAGTVTATNFAATSNGAGTSFKVGDDVWIGDVNVSNTMAVQGVEDATKGYIVFGNANNTAYIGRDGTNPITVTGSFNITGTTTLATSLTGLLKASSGVVSAASAGTDFASPSQTFYLGTTSIAINRASGSISLAGVSIDGSAPAGSLTGSTLASGVTASSLTSTGTLTSVTTSGDITLNTNNKSIKFTTTTGANVSLIQQNDDNLVLYSTNASSAQRAIWSVFGQSSTSTFNVSAPLQVKDVRDTVYPIGTGSNVSQGTITPDAANGNLQTVTLTGSITFNAFANPVSGQSITMIITQPSSGGPATLSSSMKFANGAKTLSTAANAIDMLTVSYIGSTYYASLITGFA